MMIERFIIVSKICTQAKIDARFIKNNLWLTYNQKLQIWWVNWSFTAELAAPSTQSWVTVPMNRKHRV